MLSRRRMSHLASALAVLFAISLPIACSPAESDEPTTCRSDRLPKAGTACDMADGTYCRLGSCGTGCADECACRSGLWVCSNSCRDWYGCAAPGGGCQDSPCESQGPDTGPSCVSYDAPPIDGLVAYDGGETFDAPLPACVPRCGATKAFDGFWSANALPTGSCTPGAKCDLAAVPTCGCSEDRGPVNGYVCSCELGRWRCLVHSPGGAICRSSCGDAGDAALDGG